MSDLVQSVRGIGCKRGYPYYAYGLYQPTVAKKGGYMYYRLVNSGPSFRSDVRGRTAFPDVPVVSGVRHGTRIRLNPQPSTLNPQPSTLNQQDTHAMSALLRLLRLLSPRPTRKPRKRMGRGR